MFDSADGLKYYDFLEGKGPIAEKGLTVQVCLVTFGKGKKMLLFCIQDLLFSFHFMFSPTGSF